MSALYFFKESEKKSLKLALNISKILTGNAINLSVADIDIKFTRRNYENTQGKAQVLTTMLANDKIDPKLAFEHCGMFSDPMVAYKQSMDYYENKVKEQQKQLKEAIKGHKDDEDE